MKNTGKVFEDNFKKSIPDFALLYRLPDSAQSFGRSSKLRFSNKNKFDYILWDSRFHILYALELKSVKGKSISFERTKEDSGVIHYHQIEGLNEWDKYDGTVCGFIIEFRELEVTIFINIQEFNYLLRDIPKKSFNYSDLEKYGIKYYTISQKKLRKNFRYDVDKMLYNVTDLAFNIQRKV